MDKTLGVVMGLAFALVMLVVVSGMLEGVVPQPTPGAFACPYCDQSFDTLDELVEHVASEHPDEPPIQPIEIEILAAKEAKGTANMNI